MEKVLNKDEAHPELIATYMDSLAKGKHGKDTISEDDIIDFGNTALELLRYIAVMRDVLVYLPGFALLFIACLCVSFVCRTRTFCVISISSFLVVVCLHPSLPR